MLAESRRQDMVRTYVFVVIGGAGIAMAVALFLDATAFATVEVSLLGVLSFSIVGFGLQVAEHRLTVGTAHGTISFIVYMGAALVFGPAWGAVITAVSLAGAQLIMRKPPIKTAFNVAQHVLAILIGSFLYIAIGGTIPPHSLTDALLPFVGLALGFFAVNSAAVSGVIALSEGRRFMDVWVRNTWSLVAYHLVASALAIGIAWLYLRVGVLGIAIVVVPILFLRHTILVNVQLQETNRELLDLMVKSIEARDPYTSGHSQRVSEYARTLARAIGMNYRETDHVATAALLHDVGKIYEEFAPILRKEGKLDPPERALMETHVERSAELVNTISMLRGPVERYIRHHHENFDGTGYPTGLVGDEIPIGARIIMVADTTDAMTTDRPYRGALSFEDLVSELRECAGKQFDPRVVEAFLRSPLMRRTVEAQAASESSELDRGRRTARLALR